MGRPLSVLSARESSAAMSHILDLHFPTAQTALDVTWGRGVFWKGIDLEVTGGDVDPAKAKDYVGDARQIPFPDKSFDVGVVDLPFLESTVNSPRGTRLGWSYSAAFPNTPGFVDATVEAAKELERVCRMGFIVKLKDMVRCGKYLPVSAMVMAGYKIPYDLLVFVPQVTLATDPKWKTIQHFRRQESYFLIYKGC